MGEKIQRELKRVIETLKRYLSGKEKALELTLICLLARGHLLIEDLPGVGKTTLALSVAKILGLSFSRIQGTSDLIPSDITGASLYNKRLEAFEFHKGPIFANVVLVDEINRMSPKTQSALLEPMEEEQVTVDGVTYELPRPFFLIATQNPIEHYGTFPLPEAQLDRFLMKISIGYPPRELEREILKRGSLKEELSGISAVFRAEEILRIQREVKEIYVSEKVFDYILDIVSTTRGSPYLEVGLSTRGALSLLLSARARAYLYGRDFVLPEDVKELSSSVLTHRLIFKAEYEGEKERLVKGMIESLKIPL